MSEDERPVSVEMEIADGRTTITVTGDRSVAIVVRSASGERIYLPPEGFDEDLAFDGDAAGSSAYQPSDSPYQSSDSPYQASDSTQQSADSPYQSSDSPYQTSDSPYQSPGATQTPGLETTASGFRIVHPEPVTDFRILR